MAQVIDLEGLSEPVATAIAETAVNLKKYYREPPTKSGTPLNR